MTKKDYVLIAAAMSSSKPNRMHIAASAEYKDGCENQFRLACDMLATALQRENDRFDRTRFLAACGVAS